MFGVGTIRTRINYTDAVPVGPPSRPSTGAGAESALQRTRSLLEGTVRQQKLVTSNPHLAPDIRSDELASLSLLRSLLEDLETCIMENENPPASVSKRKTLIKVEKARRGVLAAVRECAGHVTESQKLCEEIERFIELRPEEPVSPRNFHIKWSRKVSLVRSMVKRREPLLGRKTRVEESLVMSIIGLSAIAEGRDRDTPTSDASGPTSLLQPLSAKSKVQDPTDAQRVAFEPTIRQNKDLVKAQQDNAATAERTAAVPNIGGVPGRDECQQYSRSLAAAAAAATAPAAAPQTVQDAALLLQQMQLQPRRPQDFAEMEDDLKPSSSHDVAPSSITTMCNMDSCISGLPPRGLASTVAAVGGDVTSSNLRSYGAYEDGTEDDEEDEVNSAERETGSPDHCVSLLGCAKTAAAAAAAAASKAAAAAAAADPATQSTASAPPRLRDLRPVSGGGDTVIGGAVGMPIGGAGAAAHAAQTAQAMEAMPQSQESLHGNRSLVGSDPRRRTSGTNVLVSGAVHVQLQAALPASRGPGAAAMDLALVDAARAEVLLAEGNQADAAASELDAIGHLAGNAAQLPGQWLMPPQPRYLPLMPRQQVAIVAGSSGGVVQTAPQLPHTTVYGHSAAPPQPNYSQHPAQAAAMAAAAAHPYGTSGYPNPHPYLSSNSLPPHATAAASNPGAYTDATLNILDPQSVPPPLPNSLRDFPVTGAPARPSHAGSGGSGGRVLAGPGARHITMQPISGHQSLDSGQFPASATAWDAVSLADTEPVPGAQGQRNGQRRRRRGGPGGLLGIVRNVVGFVGVSVLSGAAMALGAAAVNTGLDEQEAVQQARERHRSGARRGQQRIGRGGGDDLIPQRALQQLRSPDLLALGRG